jgi:hypothetical protein
MSKNCSKLQEERAADFRAMLDVEKAMEAVVWMEQCIRDSHKLRLTRSSQDLADKRL